MSQELGVASCSTSLCISFNCHALKDMAIDKGTLFCPPFSAFRTSVPRLRSVTTSSVTTLNDRKCRTQ
jgi:hypothetical protein